MAAAPEAVGAEGKPIPVPTHVQLPAAVGSIEGMLQLLIKPG